MMAKLHHKLQYLTRFVNQDLQLANARFQDPRHAVDLATATVGTALHDMSKALRIRPVIASSERNYDNRRHPYNLKLAILVSKHRVLTRRDYQELFQKVRESRLPHLQEIADRYLPLKKVSWWKRIF